MGFKAVDLTPFTPTGPTENIPPSKEINVKAFTVARTDTTPKLGVVLKGNASIIDFLIIGPAANPLTSASLSIGNTVANANEYVNAQDVKTAGGMVHPTTAYQNANLPNLENIPLPGTIPVYAKYAEVGTASTVGGPWTVIVMYVL